MISPSMYPHEIPSAQPRSRRKVMRRWSDRLERAVLVGAFVLVPIAPVVGVTVGQQSLAGAAAVAADRAASGYQTTAVLIEDAPLRATSAAARGLVTGAVVQARWQAPDGSERTGSVMVRGVLFAGQTVPLWVDSKGEPTAAPAPAGEQRAGAVVVGTGAGLGWLVLLAGIVVATRRVLDRRRLRDWGDEWAAVEPAWRRELL